MQKKLNAIARAVHYLTSCTLIRPMYLTKKDDFISSPQKAMKHFKFRISGRVQGVWYRASTQRKAQELGLTGFVRNEPDGSVYVEAEGEESQLLVLAEWCRRGPELARVERVDVEEGTVQGFSGFKVVGSGRLNG